VENPAPDDLFRVIYDMLEKGALRSKNVQTSKNCLVSLPSATLNLLTGKPLRGNSPRPLACIPRHLGRW